MLYDNPKRIMIWFISARFLLLLAVFSLHTYA